MVAPPLRRVAIPQPSRTCLGTRDAPRPWLYSGPVVEQAPTSELAEGDPE